MTRPFSITASTLLNREGVPLCFASQEGGREGCRTVSLAARTDSSVWWLNTVLLVLILYLLQSQQINTHTLLKCNCKAKFLNLGTVGILGQTILCCGGCPVRCRIFGSNAGLGLLVVHPLCSPSSHPFFDKMSLDAAMCSPERQNCPS